ncbi:hypothetical protein EB796_012498 [Bugula neritina]|uniref:Uncharacterized protein n=1 Tax=Bugula neritina TaxID=10212 RepID=A0A7J7JT89_BUGNE|nr:hypothetical protein EB796_012498 [Bugula neritina]
MPWAMPALVGYGNGYSKSMTIYHPLPYFSITLINMKRRAWTCDYFIHSASPPQHVQHGINKKQDGSNEACNLK